MTWITSDPRRWRGGAARRLLALALPLALVAGCGGDDDKPRPATPTATRPAATATATAPSGTATATSPIATATSPIATATAPNATATAPNATVTPTPPNASAQAACAKLERCGQCFTNSTGSCIGTDACAARLGSDVAICINAGAACTADMLGDCLFLGCDGMDANGDCQ